MVEFVLGLRGRLFSHPPGETGFLCEILNVPQRGNGEIFPLVVFRRPSRQAFLRVWSFFLWSCKVPHLLPSLFSMIGRRLDPKATFADPCSSDAFLFLNCSAHFLFFLRFAGRSDEILAGKTSLAQECYDSQRLFIFRAAYPLNSPFGFFVMMASYVAESLTLSPLCPIPSPS